MKGDPKIIERLNECLTAELSAINQYFIHSRMCENWGYLRLAKKKYEESVDEMKDADALIKRILYLDGTPNMQRLNPVRVGEDPVEQHTLDLELEKENIERLNAAIALCRENRLPIIVLDISVPGSLRRIAAGEEVGTRVGG